jgi:purine-binding chemotaxis protein CheW
MGTVVVFKIDEQRLALPVTRVQRVIWAVEITALPGQNENMLGMINVEGKIIPVLNIRHLLGLAERELDLDDHIVIVEVEAKQLSFVVDLVEGVLHYQQDDLSALSENSSSYAQSVLKQEGELIVILNPAQLTAQTMPPNNSKEMLAGIN